MKKVLTSILFILAAIGLFFLGTWFGAFITITRILQSGACSVEQLEKVFPL